MVIVKCGTYKLLEDCMGLIEGNFVTVTKVTSYGYIQTTVHSRVCKSTQPVELIKEYVDEV